MLVLLLWYSWLYNGVGIWPSGRRMTLVWVAFRKRFPWSGRIPVLRGVCALGEWWCTSRTGRFAFDPNRWQGPLAINLGLWLSVSVSLSLWPLSVCGTLLTSFILLQHWSCLFLMRLCMSLSLTLVVSLCIYVRTSVFVCGMGCLSVRLACIGSGGCRSDEQSHYCQGASRWLTQKAAQLFPHRSLLAASHPGFQSLKPFYIYTPSCFFPRLWLLLRVYTSIRIFRSSKQNFKATTDPRAASLEALKQPGYLRWQPRISRLLQLILRRVCKMVF